MIVQPIPLMYANASDENAGILLGVFSGQVSDTHYETSLAEMARIDRVAADRGIPFAYVAVVDRDVPRPPAVWRKRFSEANHGVKSERFFFVMVTTSMLIRGVFAAVNWVTERREGQLYAVVGTTDDAQLWLQANGLNITGLRELEQRARCALIPDLCEAQSKRP